MSTDLYNRGRVTVTRFAGGEERGVCVQITTSEEYLSSSERLRLDGFRGALITLDVKEAGNIAEVLAHFAVSSLPGAKGDGSLEDLARAYLAAYDAAAKAAVLEKAAKSHREEAMERLLAKLGEDDAIKLDGRLISPTKRFRVATRPDAFEAENVEVFHRELARAGLICKPHAQALASMWREDWENGEAVPEALERFFTAESVRGISVRRSS